MAAVFGSGHRQIAEIIPGFLYLSDIMCASDDATLLEVGITHVVSALSAPIPWLGPGPNSPCRVLHIRCDDTQDDDILTHFETTNAFINEAYRETVHSGKKNKVLCHCLAGVSRSPTIVAAYLISAGVSKDAALDLLRERRTVVDPNPGFVNQLGIFETQIRDSPQESSPGATPWSSVPKGRELSA